MNTMPEEEIEKLLRLAPKLKPPAGLKERLIAQVQLPETRPAAQPSRKARASCGWLRRWWPALAPATVSLACAVVLTVQQMEIRDLKASIGALTQAPAATDTVASAPPARTKETAPPTDAEASEEQEIARLTDLASRLAEEVAQLEQIRAENEKLRAQLAAPTTGAFTPEETEALAKARERAMSIQCVNNLKQLGLAARVWSLDHKDLFPPNILSMTNEMPTPKILFCPADTARQAATDWASYTAANCSYEFLAPSGNEDESERVLFRCPVHGHIGLCDGHVESRVAKDHSDWLVQRDGKLYLQHPAQQPETAPAPPPGDSNPNPNP